MLNPGDAPRTIQSPSSGRGHGGCSLGCSVSINSSVDIIIIHLLGLAPAGWVAAPAKRADARLGTSVDFSDGFDNSSGVFVSPV
jgi:hypothetical protein